MIFNKQNTNRKFYGLVFYIFILFYLLYGTPAAPDTAQANKLFEQGVINYRNAIYSNAYQIFQSLLSLPEPNPYLTSAYLMSAKTAEKLGNYDKAESYAKYLIAQYPQSRYVADCHFLLGTLNLNKELLPESLEQFALTIEFSRSDTLTLKSSQIADVILNRGIKPEKIESLENSYPWKKADEYIQLWLAQSYLQQGNIAKSDSVINAIKLKNPHSQILIKAKTINDKNRNNRVRIGVILPVTGYFSTEAKDMLRGMALALHQNSFNDKIEVVVADSKGNIVDAVNTATDLLKEDISLVIGELEDNISSALAGLTSQKNMPLLVPLATNNGIAAIGNSTFQTNNDLNTRGAALAEFACNNMQMKTFATIAPADEYGNAITDAFTKKVDQLGGTIIAQKWYYPGSNDLKRQFDAIREAGFRYSFRDSLTKYGLEITPARIDSFYNALNYFIKEESDDDEGLIESTDIEVNSIDGLFMPVYEEELSIIAPQMALSNIVTKPLGGGFWLNEKQLRIQRNYINGAIFVTSYFISETDPKYRLFTNQFREYTSTSPGKMSLYGYNIMNLIIQAVKAGYTNSRDIVSYLEKVNNYECIGGKISFIQNNRVNSAVNIIQFQDGNLYKIN
ncbi:penicillin-binding protein activator [candidate division KSB1 bacterium]|nr:penicillin-binding protein activator [candidate division KSB1 bacterium]